MNSRFTLTKNTLFQLGGRALTSITTVFIIILVTNQYSHGFGALIAILSYIGIFYVFSDFGLNAIVVKNILDDKAKEETYFKNLLGLRLVLSLAVVFFALAILSFTNHPSLVKVGIIFGLSTIVLQSLFTTTQAFFQARERFDLFVFGDVLGAFTTLALVFLTTLMGGSILFLVGAYVVGMAVRFVASSYIIRSEIKSFSASFDTKLWVTFLKAAFPIGLVLIFSQLNANIDKQIVFLADYKESLGITGEEAVAIYGLAYRIFEFGIVLPAFILNSAYPIMIQKKNESLTSLLDFSKRLFVGMLALGVVCMVFGLLAAPLLVEILGSGRLNEAVLTSQILFLSFPIFFVTTVSLWLLITLEKRKEMAFIYGLAALFSIAAGIFFVPLFGYNAAAVITVMAEILIFVLSSGVLLITLKNSQKGETQVEEL